MSILIESVLFVSWLCRFWYNQFCLCHDFRRCRRPKAWNKPKQVMQAGSRSWGNWFGRARLWGQGQPATLHVTTNTRNSGTPTGTAGCNTQRLRIWWKLKTKCWICGNRDSTSRGSAMRRKKTRFVFAFSKLNGLSTRLKMSRWQDGNSLLVFFWPPK